MIRRSLALVVLLAALALAACGEKDEDTAGDLPEGCTAVEAPLPRTEKLDKPGASFCRVR